MPDGQQRPVPGSSIIVGPWGAQAWVPFAATWWLTGNGTDPATLQLNNPLEANLVRLRARRLGPAGYAISVTVTESQIGFGPVATRAINGGQHRLMGRLQVEATPPRLLAHGRGRHRLSSDWTRR